MHNWDTLSAGKVGQSYLSESFLIYNVETIDSKLLSVSKNQAHVNGHEYHSPLLYFRIIAFELYL